MHNKNYIKRLIFASLIAAIYAAITYLCLGFSFTNIQFRIAEVLTILPCFTPTAIIGLTVGCFIANFASFNLFDLFFGTLATLISSVISYLLRNVKFKNIPFLSILSPVLINGIIIGLELSIFFTESNLSFPILALCVAFGEAVVCFGLGIPLYLILNKYKDIFKDM